MNSMQQYAELIHAFQAYFTQEHPKGTWISTDPQTYDYFLKLACSNQKVENSPKPLLVAQNTPSGRVNTNTRASYSKDLASTRHAPPLKEQVKIEIQSLKAPIKESTPKPELAAESKPLQKDVLHRKQITLEAPPAVNSIDFTEMKTFFKEKLPRIVLSETIADDAEAKNFALRWKAPPAKIIVLSFSTNPAEQAFLSNLSIALHQYFGSTKLVSAASLEEEKGWDRILKADTLHLAIASHNSLHALPELMKYYHEESTGKHRLGQAQLFLLSDLSLYMQQPALKASLWRTLAQQNQKLLGNKF